MLFCITFNVSQICDGSYTCTEIKESAILIKASPYADIWRSKKSLTVAPAFFLSFSHFSSPVLVGMDVFNQKPFPLKHALTQRVSKPLCNRQSSGEFI